MFYEAKLFALLFKFCELFNGYEDEIHQPPAFKCPVCSVPDARKEPDDKKVEKKSLFGFYSSSADRQIKNIIIQ